MASEHPNSGSDRSDPGRGLDSQEPKTQSQRKRGGSPYSMVGDLAEVSVVLAGYGDDVEDLAHSIEAALVQTRTNPQRVISGAKVVRRLLADAAGRAAEPASSGVEVRAPTPQYLDFEERGGGLLDLEAALVDLEKKDLVLVTLVELRFFGGCSMEECARLLDRSLRNVQRDWRFAKDWLRRRLMASAWPGLSET